MNRYENRRRQVLMSPLGRVFASVFETILRLPGLILLELWWRVRMRGGDDVLPTQWKAEFQRGMSSILEVSEILQFVHTRDFDQSAGLILSYSILLLSVLFLLLPLLRLVSLYLHMISVLLLGFAQYMSIRYVQLERESGLEVVLDDFVKLERHVFHGLAQVLLGLTISCLLRIQSAAARASLAVFCVPIVVRMCGYPVEKLMIVHNFACSGAMLIICFYLLNSSPILLHSIGHAYRQLKATLVQHGLFDGLLITWRQLRLSSLLSTAWLALWSIRVYLSVIKHDSFRLLLSTAESTETPLGLFGLTLTVSYASQYILTGAKFCLEGSVRIQAHDFTTALMQVSWVDTMQCPFAEVQGGYTEGATMVLLALQTGLLSLQPLQRAFLLELVLFIVLSALLQSLFELLEPHLLNLGASRHHRRLRHYRALLLSTLLFFGPIGMTVCITRVMQPFDLWSLIIVSNCLLTSLQTLSTVIVYCLFLIEAKTVEPWEKFDDVVFYCKAVTQALEMFLAIFIIVYGLYASIFMQWSYSSAFVLIFHCYFNVWQRLQSGWNAFKLRRKAAESISMLAQASREQLDNLRDLCSICFTEMVQEVRMTPCNHFFHGACLKKWLFVKQTCPLCHGDLSVGSRIQTRSAPSHTDSEEGYSSEWPGESEYESSFDDSSESSRGPGL